MTSSSSSSEDDYENVSVWSEEQKLRYLEKVARDLPAAIKSGKIIYPDTNETTLQSLSCANCSAVPFGEVRKCGLAHVLCRKCLVRLPGKDRKSCPVPACDAGVSMSSFSRSYTLEKVIREGKFLCPQGCKAVLNGHDMFVHLEDDCKNREVLCPLCHEQNGDDGVEIYGVKAVDLTEHLKTHEIDFKDRQRHRFFKTINLKSEAFAGMQHLPPNMFKFDEQLFIVNFRIQHIDYFDPIFVMWVQIVADCNEATKYRSIIKLCGKENREVSWNIPVVVATDKRPGLGEVGSLTLNQLHSFVTHFELNPIEKTVFKFEPHIYMIKLKQKQLAEPEAEAKIVTE